MAYRGDMSKFFAISTLYAVLLISAGATAQPITFASPMGDENWKMTGNPIRCGLSLKIPNYGVGYFEQFATKEPHFILRTWSEVLKAEPTIVLARPPVWKPGRPSYLVTKSYIKPGEYGVYLSREPTLKLLTYLSQGYQANFNYRSAEGFATTIALSPIRFQRVYSKYQQCLGSLLSFNYDNVRETVFHFGVDNNQLTDADKDQLKRVALYVAADIQVESIKIAGYADESGRKGYNNAVSQFRAERVYKYLLKIGVPKSKLSVTWYGALKPIARNDTEEGRAENRRVVVNLIRK